MKEKFCDLHCHSTFSDGSMTPSELVEYAQKKGICTIALTDHNTVRGHVELEAAAKKAGLEYSLGAELSTEYDGKETHLLALFIDEKSREYVEDFAKKRHRIKKNSNIDLEKRLVDDGYEISLEEIEKRYGDNINRAHFAKTLVEKGYVKSTNEAFEDILKEGGKYYKSTPRPDLLTTVKELSELGCVTVLAHPLLNLTREELEGALSELCPLGLCGIEVYYPLFNEDEKEYLHALASSHGLVACGGSDFHGNVKNSGDLGDAKVLYSAFCELKERRIVQH